jgi:flagellar biosynthesis/type III secretory pathway protein FliH
MKKCKCFNKPTKVNFVDVNFASPIPENKEEILKSMREMDNELKAYAEGVANGYEQGHKDGWNAALEYVIARFTKSICKGEE